MIKELNKDYVLKIIDTYDTQWEFDTFILGGPIILAHGGLSRNSMYPLDEALFNLALKRGLIGDTYEEEAEVKGDLELLETLIEGDGLIITELVGNSQGDYYYLVTEEPIQHRDFYEDIYNGNNHYHAELLRIGRGRLVFEDGISGFHIPDPDKDDIDNILQYFEVDPAYYLLEIDSSYSESDFKKVLNSLGLQDWNEVED